MQTATEQETIFGGAYVVIFENGLAYFYDDAEPEFHVKAELAETQEMRDALATVYDLGLSNGRVWGRGDMKRDFRKLLDL